MKRILLISLGGAALLGAGVFGLRGLAASRENDDLHRRLAQVTADLEQVKGSVSRLDGSMAGVGRRMASAALTPVHLQAGSVGHTGSGPSPTMSAEEQDRQEAEAAAKGERQLEAYHAGLEQQLKTGRPSPALVARLRKNIETTPTIAGRPMPWTVQKVECTEQLCRMEVTRIGAPSALHGSALPRLTMGMSEVSLSHLAGNRAVLYAAPDGQKLPPMDL
jgi:hypothetical protein